ALLALRTQQILAFETGVADSADPLGGSYYIEKLTDKIEAAARAYLAKIEALGGVLRAIEAGFQQREIQGAAYEFQKAVERGDRVIVGVNRYASAEAAPVPIVRLDPHIEQEQVKRLANLRARRDGSAVKRALREIEEAANGDENLMPAILRAVKSRATVGEISAALRRIFGEFRESTQI
ncbi:MAG: methylmalonyl-CoA mutase family protein, partial [Terriglobia bacterium]